MCNFRQKEYETVLYLVSGAVSLPCVFKIDPLHGNVNTVRAVCIGDEITDWFEVKLGTGQGEIQAPLIFLIILNWGMKRAMAERTTLEGLLLQKCRSSQYLAVHIINTDYAEAIAVLDSCADDLQKATTNSIL